MQAVSRALIEDSGLGHALHLVDTGLLDHVLGWAAVNPRALDALGCALVSQRCPRTSSAPAPIAGARSWATPSDGWRSARHSPPVSLKSPSRSTASSPRPDASGMSLRRGQRSVKTEALPVNDNARLFLAILQDIPFELPPGRIVEWDHIYPQAKASHMRWHGPDGQQRKQHHPRRSRVWHGANLWALDRDINHAASDIWPSAKFALLGSLPDPARDCHRDGRRTGSSPISSEPNCCERRPCSMRLT